MIETTCSSPEPLMQPHMIVNTFSSLLKTTSLHGRRRPSEALDHDGGSAQLESSRPLKKRQKFKRVKFDLAKNESQDLGDNMGVCRKTLCYTLSDYNTFRAECRQALAAFIKCDGNLFLLNDNKHCTRGLEPFIRSFLFGGSIRTRECLVVKQVIAAQIRQQQAGASAFAPQALSIISSTLSCESARRARSVAVADADAAHDHV